VLGREPVVGDIVAEQHHEVGPQRARRICSTVMFGPPAWRSAIAATVRRPLRHPGGARRYEVVTSRPGSIAAA
jgi:hypothetical protein